MNFPRVSITHFLFFLKSQKGPFDNVLLDTGHNNCSRQCVRLCHFTADTFYRCLRCLKQHQAQLVKIPDMYLLSTLYYTIVISWFANCYRKKNDVCLICINITTYVMSQQHRCSKGIVDVSHNIVTVSACFYGFLIAFLNCKFIYLDSS